MKKIIFPTILVVLPMLSQAATAATQLDTGFKLGPAIILIAMLCLFVMVGFLFRAKDTSDFYVAGNGISRVGSGMAIASNWMSAASFLGMAALMYGTGYHGLAYVVGWTGGYVLLLILMAGQIRKYGKYVIFQTIWQLGNSTKTPPEHSAVSDKHTADINDKI